MVSLHTGALGYHMAALASSFRARRSYHNQTNLPTGPSLHELKQKSKYHIYVSSHVTWTGADLGGGCRGCAPLPLGDDLRFSNTTSILQKKKKKTMWFIAVEVEQEKSAPPPKNNPGSAPVRESVIYMLWCSYGCINPKKIEQWNEK